MVALFATGKGSFKLATSSSRGQKVDLGVLFATNCPNDECWSNIQTTHALLIISHCLLLATTVALCWQSVINSSILALNWSYMATTLLAICASVLLLVSLYTLYNFLSFSKASLGVAFSCGPAGVEFLVSLYMLFLCCTVTRKRKQKPNDGLRVTATQEKVARQIFDDIEFWGIGGEDIVSKLRQEQPEQMTPERSTVRRSVQTALPTTHVSSSDDIDKQTIATSLARGTPKIFQANRPRRRKGQVARSSRRPRNPPPLPEHATSSRRVRK